MENKWLIRTTQNKIFGPFSKSKVLEFLKNKSLDPNDELASGNGHWFYLREYDLVEKYIYGDVPQGFNPISEAKSVLFQRENPDKTSSLNTAPANAAQVVKLDPNGIGALPLAEDLEYPDISLVHKNIAHSISITTSSPKIATPEKESIAIKVKENNVDHGNGEELYPKSEDLEYPDLKEMHSTHELQEDDRDYKVVPKTFENNSSSYKIEEIKVIEVIKAIKAEVKGKMYNDFNNEFEKDSGLALERKPKSQKNTSNDDSSSEVSKVVTIEKRPNSKIDHSKREMPERLKKRNDNYLIYLIFILILIILGLFFYYYKIILNKPLPI